MARKNDTSKKTTYKKLENTKGKLIDAGEKGQILTLVEEQPIYSFRYTLAGKFFFTREDGSIGIIEGGQILDDITEKERRILLKNSAFTNGYLVEESEDLPKEEYYNRNALNERQIAKLVKKHSKDDPDFWREHIENIDSIHAVKRLRQVLADVEFPNSILTYCDSRVVVLEEEFAKEMEEPIDEPPRGV